MASIETLNRTAFYLTGTETVLRVGICLGFLLLTGLCIVIFSWFQTKKLRVRKIDADEGVKGPRGSVCLISDLHFPMFLVSPVRVIDSIRNGDPDCILIAGDLAHKEEGKAKMLDFLRALAAEMPEVPIRIVLGNHDKADLCGNRPEKIRAYCESLRVAPNVEVLVNEAERLPLKGADRGLVLAGLDDVRTGNREEFRKTLREAAERKIEGDRLIVLEHNPDVAELMEPELKALGDVLVLSGHTHGGQFFIPFRLEFLLLRKDRLPKKGFVYGLYRYAPGVRLFITCGLGECVLPIRLGTLPEVVFLKV